MRVEGYMFTKFGGIMEKKEPETKTVSIEIFSKLQKTCSLDLKMRFISRAFEIFLIELNSFSQKN